VIIMELHKICWTSYLYSRKVCCVLILDQLNSLYVLTPCFSNTRCMISPLLPDHTSDLVHTVKHVIGISRILTKSTWPPQTRSQFLRQLLSGRALEKHNVPFCAVISVLREVSRICLPTCIKLRWAEMDNIL